MKDLGAGGASNDAALEKMIRAGVKRLIDFQNDKGRLGVLEQRRHRIRS